MGAGPVFLAKDTCSPYHFSSQIYSKSEVPRTTEGSALSPVLSGRVNNVLFLSRPLFFNDCGSSANCITTTTTTTPPPDHRQKHHMPRASNDTQWRHSAVFME